MLSKTCQYTLRAAMYLAANTDKEKKAAVKEVAKELGLSAPHTAKILQNLAFQKIVSSTKGPGGGFFATENTATTPVLKIIHLVEGEDFFRQCMLGLKECSDTFPCPIHHQVKSHKMALKKVFDDTLLSELKEDFLNKKSFLNDDWT